jgi:hypothetical protein
MVQLQTALGITHIVLSVFGWWRGATSLYLRKRVENGARFERGMLNAGAGFVGIFDGRKRESKTVAGGNP